MEKKHMVKHVILWTLKNEYSKEEKEAIKAEIKACLLYTSKSSYNMKLDNTNFWRHKLNQNTVSSI